jgi:hypothetical protein
MPAHCTHEKQKQWNNVSRCTNENLFHTLIFSAATGNEKRIGTISKRD